MCRRDIFPPIWGSLIGPQGFPLWSKQGSSSHWGYIKEQHSRYAKRTSGQQLMVWDLYQASGSHATESAESHRISVDTCNFLSKIEDMILLPGGWRSPGFTFMLHRPAMHGRESGRVFFYLTTKIIWCYALHWVGISCRTYFTPPTV